MSDNNEINALNESIMWEDDEINAFEESLMRMEKTLNEYRPFIHSLLETIEPGTNSSTAIASTASSSSLTSAIKSTLPISVSNSEK